jgi:hypothetical protein
MMKLSWIVVVLFLYRLGAAKVTGFLIPKVQVVQPHQPLRPQDGGGGALNAIQVQELSRRAKEQRASSPGVLLTTESSPILWPELSQQQQQQHSNPSLLQQQYQKTTTVIHTQDRSTTTTSTTLGTILCFAVVATLAATDAKGYYNLDDFFPNVFDAMVPTSMNDTLAWATGEVAGLALVALCSVLLRLSSHPIGSDREHHDLFCPAEIFSDIVMWLEFAVLEDYYYSDWLLQLTNNNPGLELALFGSICGASSLMYADILSGAFYIGSSSRREVVLSRKWTDWIRVYFFRCISSIALFGVFEHVEQLLSSISS